MIKYILISGCVSGVTRIYISKKKIKNKTLISLAAGFSITLFLEIIQLIIGGIVCLVF